MRKKKITIGIIGFGRFGALAASVLKQYGEVSVYDTKNERAKARRIGVKFTDMAPVAGSDIVILSAPISQTEKTIKKISKLVKQGALVLDTCSVKVLPCKWLKRHLPKSVELIGTHPMFGPITTGFNERKQTWNLKGLQIVLCPVRAKPAILKKLKIFLASLGLEVIIVSPQEHDLETAETLGFMHFLGRSLWESGFREKKIYPPGYRDLLGVYRTTTGDSWELMYDMNIYNPYAKEARKRFMKKCTEIGAKIRKRGAKKAREGERGGEGGNKALDDLRLDINTVDNEIMQLLNQRFQIVEKIGKIKKANNNAVINKTREYEIIKNNSRNSGLDKKFVESLYRLIFEEAYKRQKQ